MKRIILISLLVLILGAGILAGFWLLLRNKNNVVLDNKIKPVETVVFEKLKLDPNDLDGDGILDTKEKEIGTSNRDSDTDGDSLTDKEEIEVYKTDPTKVDTDDDGYWDGYEIINNYNPLGAGKLVK
ncbi:MAG: Calcium-binding protein [Candidatus Magasanikbacteria bacterium GW2011_GWC2_37_14]|uniref:Calcium-binding protein n=1 Tax=Candidatus Magasanikbacteria bacterium GW2011_GWC2_37_14 TaxID=1619046 RepID=A0A0G0IU23_9BACT|nr:MAG: Calcium-binding protein [Candidatus Magasanikbacteria bacterium GW2011_GWC2_37_14]